MKKMVIVVLLALLVLFVSLRSGFAGVAICGPHGEYLYKKHCSGCHRDPVKLKRVADLTSSMRNPPAAMPQFGKEKISDSDAQEIADYIRLGSVAVSVSKTAGERNAPATIAQRR